MPVCTYYCSKKKTTKYQVVQSLTADEHTNGFNLTSRTFRTLHIVELATNTRTTWYQVHRSRYNLELHAVQPTPLFYCSIFGGASHAGKGLKTHGRENLLLL